MDELVRSPGEITRLVLAEATRQIGPWPTNLDIFVYRTGESWKCLVTPTNNPDELTYRRAVLKLGRKLEKTIKLKA